MNLDDFEELEEYEQMSTSDFVGPELSLSVGSSTARETALQCAIAMAQPIPIGDLAASAEAVSSVVLDLAGYFIGWLEEDGADVRQ